MKDNLRDQAINAYYSAGGLFGPLGVPLGPVEFHNGSEAHWRTSGGYIVARSDGTSRIVSDQFIRVSFVGMKCECEPFPETDHAVDELYFICTVLSPGSSRTSMIEFSSVNTNSEVRRMQLLADRLPPLTSYLHVAMTQHDYGSARDSKHRIADTMAKLTAAARQAGAAYDMSQVANADRDFSPEVITSGLLNGGLPTLGIVPSLDATGHVCETSEELFGSRHGYLRYPPMGELKGTPYTHDLEIKSGNNNLYHLYFDVQLAQQERPILTPDSTGPIFF